MMWLMRPALSTCTLEQPSRTLPAADAHGDDSVARLAPRHFVGQRSHHPRPGHAKGMANRNRSSVHIHFLRVDFQTIAAINHLYCKRFVEFPEVDVAGFHAGTLQQPRHCKNRSDAHFVRVATRDLEATKN